MFDWNELDKEQASKAPQQYKPYAPNGEYTVKLEMVEVYDKEGWKSPALRFIWSEDDERKYCSSVYHWLSVSNEKYRREHNRYILMALGIEKEKAQELINTAEKDQSRDGLKKGYEAMYKTVASRKPSVKIVIQDQWRDGKPVVKTSEKGTEYTPNESDFATFGARTMDVHEEALIKSEEIDMNEVPF